MLKVICRDPKNQFAFETAETMCWPTWRLALQEQGQSWGDKLPETKRATQLSVKFRDGHAPPLEVGLDLSEPDEQQDRGDSTESQDHVQGELDAGQ